jgi:hypothetical protein
MPSEAGSTVRSVLDDESSDLAERAAAERQDAGAVPSIERLGSKPARISLRASAHSGA